MSDWQFNIDAARKQKAEEHAYAAERAARVEPGVIPFLRDTALPAFNDVREYFNQQGSNAIVRQQLDNPRTAHVELVVISNGATELVYQMSVDMQNEVPLLSVRYGTRYAPVQWPATIGSRLTDITQDEVRDNIAYHYQQSITS